MPTAIHVILAGPNLIGLVFTAVANGLPGTATTALTVSPAAPELCGNGAFDANALGWKPNARATLTQVTTEHIRAPNPLLGSGLLSFATTWPGAVKIGLYDAQGREMRRVMDEASLAPGRHQIAIGAGAAPLPAGFCFYRIAAAEGDLHGRFVLIR